MGSLSRYDRLRLYVESIISKNPMELPFLNAGSLGVQLEA